MSSFTIVESEKMVRTDIEWIKLNIKQCVLKVSFYIMLAAAAMLIYLLSCVTAKNSRNVNVMMVCENSSVGEDIADELVREAPDGYEFSYAANRDELIRKVTTGEVDCGIIFESELDSKIKKGIIKGAVLFYQYSGSSAGYVVREVIFPHILKRASNKLLEDYVLERDPDTPEDVHALIKQANDAFVTGTDINIFTVKEIKAQDDVDKTSAPYRNYVILIASLLITIIMVAESEQDNHNYYKSLKNGVRIKRRTEAALVRIVLIGAALVTITATLL